ncbi:hypothetical protein H312_02424, partial [Anncaliia algerae PRA339]
EINTTTNKTPNDIYSNFGYSTNENTILHSYAPAMTKYGILKNLPFAYTLETIREKYLLLFYHLANIMNRTKVLDNHIFDSFIPKNVIQAYDELKDILSKNYNLVRSEDNFIISNEKDLKKLYLVFNEYKNWAFKNYILKIIFFNYSNNNLNQNYIDEQKERGLQSDDVLNLIRELLLSKNYQILLNIFPELRVIFDIKKTSIKIFKSLRIITYFKFIIAKFEIFRYDYFKDLDQDTLENLYKNENFNEILPLISYAVKMVLHDYGCCSADFMNFLEIKNFVFFLRAKYNDIFTRHEFLNLIVSSEFFKYFYAQTNRNTILKLKYYEFNERFYLETFYSTLLSIIKEYQNSINIVKVTNHESKRIKVGE